jgi:hypothetical protein
MGTTVASDPASLRNDARHGHEEQNTQPDGRKHQRAQPRLAGGIAEDYTEQPEREPEKAEADRKCDDQGGDQA